MNKLFKLVTLVSVSAMLLTGCTMTSAQVNSKLPGIVYYEGEDANSFLNTNMEWGFINSDRQVAKLECVSDFWKKSCVDSTGSVFWEPRSSKSSKYGYLTIDKGERVRFRCTTNFDGLEELPIKRFCYAR